MAGLGEAVADATDYLVAQITALSACEHAAVSDGWPKSRGAEVTVSIGVTNEDGSSEVEIEWAGLGAGREDQSFDIPLLIESYKGGATEAQAPARRAACVVLDAVNAMIRADRSLGGALPKPGVAAVRDVRLVQTNTSEEAGDGRYARIYCNVRCTSRF